MKFVNSARNEKREMVNKLMKYKYKDKLISLRILEWLNTDIYFRLGTSFFKYNIYNRMKKVHPLSMPSFCLSTEKSLLDLIRSFSCIHPFSTVYHGGGNGLSGDTINSLSPDTSSNFNGVQVLKWILWLKVSGKINLEKSTTHLRESIAKPLLAAIDTDFCMISGWNRCGGISFLAAVHRSLQPFVYAQLS